MVIFGIKTSKNFTFKKYVEDTQRRLNNNNFIKSPFNGKIERISTTFDYFYIVDIKPIIPNIPLFACVIMGMICLVFFKIPFVIAGIVFGLLSLLWSRFFFQFMFKIGLKKKGFKEKIVFLNPSKALKEVLLNGTK